MTIDRLRQICRAFPGVTEDLKWGADLAFCAGGKMFCVVNTERPHQMSFKCPAGTFAELIEREGIIPAPYLARAMWVQETELGATLEARELETLLRSAYDLVVAKLPKSKRPGAAAVGRRTNRTLTRGTDRAGAGRQVAKQRVAAKRR
ncbi:MAG: MmcQ/YjbR family DNA-binding protein [Vicinamibacterales bacterium]